MTSPNWETIEAPVTGQFYGWGNQPGQEFTAAVLRYDPTGGTDPNGNVVPCLAFRLAQAAASFSQRGTVREDLPAGTDAVLNASQVILRRKLEEAKPAFGDLINVKFIGVAPSRTGNPPKDFEVRIARGAGMSIAQQVTNQPQQPAATTTSNGFATTTFTASQPTQTSPWG